MQQRRRYRRRETGLDRDALFEILESFGKDGVTDEADQAPHPRAPRDYGGIATAVPTGRW